MSLWEVLDEVGLPRAQGVKSSRAAQTAAVADPCAARDTPGVRAAVRSLIARAGFAVVELPRSGMHTECCGYGGLQVVIDRQLTDAVVARRVAQDEHDYVAYCAMCRDLFARGGKRTWHLIDLLFGDMTLRDPGLHGPRLTERQRARALFKRDLMRELWPGEGDPVAGEGCVRLEITDEVRQKMDAELIVEDEIAAVIEASERSGRRLIDRSSAHCLAHNRQRLVTVWVEYSPVAQDCFLVHGVYSHRIEIVDEGSAEGQTMP